MRTIRATFLWIFATLDSQVILHVSQPAIAFVAVWAPEATWLLVQAAARFPGKLGARVIRG